MRRTLPIYDCDIDMRGGGVFVITRAIRSNRRARKAVDAYPSAIGTRSDNIDLLTANIGRMRPFLKGKP